MLTSYLPGMRRDAEDGMLDTFTFRVHTGTHYDAALDENVDTFVDLFTTKGRVKLTAGLTVRNAEVGGRTSTVTQRELHIPVSSPPISFADGPVYAFCTAVDVSSDPSLLGAKLRLAGPAPGSQTTARRLEILEVLS